MASDQNEIEILKAGILDVIHRFGSRREGVDPKEVEDAFENAIEFWNSYKLAKSDHDQLHQDHFLEMTRAWVSKLVLAINR